MEALAGAGKNIKAAFFFPGHKMGKGLPVGLPGPFAGTKGAESSDAVWQYDVPEIPEMDNLFAPEVGGLVGPLDLHGWVRVRLSCCACSSCVLNPSLGGLTPSHPHRAL